MEIKMYGEITLILNVTGDSEAYTYVLNVCAGMQTSDACNQLGVAGQLVGIALRPLRTQWAAR